MSEHTDQLRQSIGELVTNAYRLGMAQGSGSDVFFNGEIFGHDQLAQAQVEKGSHLEALLKAERERVRQMEEALRGCEAVIAGIIVVQKQRKADYSGLDALLRKIRQASEARGNN